MTLLKKNSLLLFLCLSFTSQAANDFALIKQRFEVYHSLGAPLFDGPNCYHSVAYLLGWTTRMTYMDSAEFEARKLKSQCQELKMGESPEAGDVGLIYGREDDQSQLLVHVFVWAQNSGEIYSKVGYYTAFEFEKTNFSQLEKWFQLKNDCLNPGSSEKTQCERYVRSFRCSVEKTPQRLNEKLHSIEMKLSSYVMGSRVVSDDDLLSLKKRIKKVESEGSRDNAFLKAWGLSLDSQIQMIVDPD